MRLSILTIAMLIIATPLLAQTPPPGMPIFPNQPAAKDAEIVTPITLRANIDVDYGTCGANQIRTSTTRTYFTDHGGGNTERSTVVSYACENLPTGTTGTQGGGDTSAGAIISERVQEIVYDGDITTVVFEMQRDGNPTGVTRTRTYNDDPISVFSGWAASRPKLLAQQAQNTFDATQDEGEGGDGVGGVGGTTITVDGEEQTPPEDR